MHETVHVYVCTDISSHIDVAALVGSTVAVIIIVVALLSIGITVFIAFVIMRYHRRDTQVYVVCTCIYCIQNTTWYVATHTSRPLLTFASTANNNTMPPLCHYFQGSQDQEVGRIEADSGTEGKEVERDGVYATKNIPLRRRAIRTNDALSGN